MDTIFKKVCFQCSKLHLHADNKHKCIEKKYAVIKIPPFVCAVTPDLKENSVFLKFRYLDI